MDTLILLSDECSELAAKLRRASESGADLSIAELQRAARELAGSLILFGGTDHDELLCAIVQSLGRQLTTEKTRVAAVSRHAESCEAKIAELLQALYDAGTRYGELLLELDALKKKASAGVVLS